MMERILLLAAAASLALAQTETESFASSTTDASFSQTSDSAASSATDASSSTTGEAITHTVDVGLAGHTFQPDVTLANVGDTVEFNFFPTNHSVIRAEYLYPCVPYEMTGRGKVGFDSGFLPVDAILDDPPKFRLLINDTNPIFYYCGAEGSCINWQMVGVINPNSSTSLEKQKQEAEDSSFMLLPGEKWPDEASDPMSGASSSSSATSSSDAASSTSSDDSSSSSSSSSSGLSTGAIAGIAVSGTIAVIGAAALLFFCGRASRRRNAQQAQQQQPLMQQGGHMPGQPPFSPGPANGHMSYVQPYPDSMNKHMSVQSMSMHSPALPGYMPQQGQTPGGPGAGAPLYGPSDALNPGAGEAYQGSPQQSPNMVPMGMAGYGQQQQQQQQYRNSMQPAYAPSPQTPYAAPHPSASPPPQGHYHEMPAAPVSDAQYAGAQSPRHGGSELSASDAPTLNNQGTGQGGQGGQGGILNFIKQNSGGR